MWTLLRVTGAFFGSILNGRNKLGHCRHTGTYDHSILEGSLYFGPSPTNTASSVAFSNESWLFFYIQHYHTPVGKTGVLHATSKPFLLLPLKTPNSLDSMPLNFRPPAPAFCGCSDHFPFTFWGCRHALHPYSVFIYRAVNIQNPHLFSSNGCPYPLSHLLFGHTLEMAAPLKAWFHPSCPLGSHL